jgi:phospholipase/lecithinase/hemolysin
VGQAAASYSQIVAFGDSLSDTGNLYNLTASTPFGPIPAAPYYNGRFSNGRLAVEVMADALGLGLTSYAVGGAQTGTGNQGGVLLAGTGVTSQVLNYKSQLGGESADASALYFLWAGANDFYTGGNMQSPTLAAQAAKQMVGNVKTLSSAGARSFYVPLMPDLSQAPSSQQASAQYRSAAQQRTQEYNSALLGGLQELEHDNPGLDIHVFDTVSFLQSYLFPLGDKGFNVHDACFSGGAVCALPDIYLFWDGYHPSELTNYMLGRAFAASVANLSPPAVAPTQAGVVPEPSTWVMSLFGGLAALAWARRHAPQRRAPQRHALR